MTFGGHLEVLRKMLFRIIGIIVLLAVAIFSFKDFTFKVLLAPCSSDFTTYRTIEKVCASVGMNIHFEPYRIQLINTELTSQFMIHLSTSAYLALLFASPYVLFELYRFVSPALYDNERRYSALVCVSVYLLFIAGVLMSYYVLFPFTIQFLGTYQVSADVVNQINISSYISSFIMLTLLMGLVFQIPVLSFFLGKLGVINATMMKRYRKHAVVVILIAAAAITPSADIFTLMLVAVPIYLLYEASIRIV